jgi:leader peptidase (prepilin peptidase) / N-methyltransferase
MEQIPAFAIGVVIFVFGLLIGSFLNVVIYRLPRRESIAFPGSHCPACNASVKPYDNIPVVSYAILGGRCRSCRVAISPVYPAVELLVATLYLLAFVKNEYLVDLPLVGDIVFLSLIVPLVFIDLRHKLLPNAITYPGFIAMATLRVLAPDVEQTALLRRMFGLVGWTDHWVALLGVLLGAVAGGGSLWLVRELYFRLRSIEGMGLGDVKMMLMVGAYLGWQLTLLTIFMASLLGSVIGVALIRLRGGNMKMEIPFGVFLGPAAIISLFVGQPLINWYLGFL